MIVITNREDIIIHNIRYEHLEIRNYSDYSGKEIVGPVKAIVDFSINSLQIKGEFKVNDYLDRDEIKHMIIEKLRYSICLVDGM